MQPHISLKVAVLENGSRFYDLCDISVHVDAFCSMLHKHCSKKLKMSSLMHPVGSPLTSSSVQFMCWKFSRSFSFGLYFLYILSVRFSFRAHLCNIFREVILTSSVLMLTSQKQQQPSAQSEFYVVI